jgi:DNA-binding beta-propeller fold protein YncE
VRRLISLLGAIAAITLLGACGGAQTPTGQPAPRAGQTAQPAALTKQTELPFTGLHWPTGVAVDTDGNLYVADHMNSRVLKLAAGSTTQTVLPFPTGPDRLYMPSAVAVDREGTVYVSDCARSRVWKLAAGSSTPTVLLENQEFVYGLAVDTAGNLYGTARNPSRVWKLAKPTGSTPPTVLPFTGLKSPFGVAVDSAGNLYITTGGYVFTAVGPWAVDSDHRVVKLSADLTTQTDLPFAGLNGPLGVAVDSTGTVYVVDRRNTGAFGQPLFADNRVLKLAAGSSTQTALPFTGLNGPDGVAVRPPWIAAPTDSVYISDSLNNRVLKLGAG